MSNTIIRAPHHDRFVIIDQRTIEDEYLSWAARGLLGYMLSRPVDWTLRVDELCGRGDLGRDGIYRLLRELREAGYVQFEHQRDENGRIRGGTYFIYETLDSPDTDMPDSAEQDAAESHPVSPATATTTHVCRSRGEADDSTVAFIAWIPEKVRAAALEAVAGLSPADAQIVIDEWSGHIAVGLVESSPLDGLRDLVSRYIEGHCRVHMAHNIKDLRAKPVPDGGYICPIELWEADSD